MEFKGVASEVSMELGLELSPQIPDLLLLTIALYCRSTPLLPRWMEFLFAFVTTDLAVNAF